MRCHFPNGDSHAPWRNRWWNFFPWLRRSFKKHTTTGCQNNIQNSPRIDSLMTTRVCISADLGISTYPIIATAHVSSKRGHSLRIRAANKTRGTLDHEMQFNTNSRNNVFLMLQRGDGKFFGLCAVTQRFTSSQPEHEYQITPAGDTVSAHHPLPME